MYLFYYSLFLLADVVNDLLAPSPVWKQPAAVNKIYDVPIIVMSGKIHFYFIYKEQNLSQLLTIIFWCSFLKQSYMRLQ